MNHTHAPRNLKGYFLTAAIYLLHCGYCLAEPMTFSTPKEKPTSTKKAPDQLKDKRSFQKMLKQAKSSKRQYSINEGAIDRFLIRDFSEVFDPKNNYFPSFQFNTPSAFGLEFGQVIAGIGYQSSRRNEIESDISAGLGVGIGNPVKSFGLEANVNLVNLIGESSNGGYLSLKAHRMFKSGFAIALGAENLFKFGSPSALTSYYLVGSTYVALGKSVHSPFSIMSISLGAGTGRFKLMNDINSDRGAINLFASLGFSIARPLSWVIEWTGNSIATGLNFNPLLTHPLSISIGVNDIGPYPTPRFLASISYALTFGKFK